MATTSKKSKKPTATQVKAIYNAGRTAYQQSYAMMVDDILEGMKEAAKKAGRTPFYDIDWFQLMARQIRAHRTWDSIDVRAREDIIEAVKRAKY